MSGRAYTMRAPCSERTEVVAATRATTAEAALRTQIARHSCFAQEGRRRREAVAPVRRSTSSPISDGTGPSGNGPASCEAREGVIPRGPEPALKLCQ